MKKTTTIKARRGRPPRADFGTRLIRAAHEAIAIARGGADPFTYHIHVPSDLDVRAIRPRTGLSQDKFAERFGLHVCAGARLGAGTLEARWSRARLSHRHRPRARSR